jgi:hypothetical protein
MVDKKIIVAELTELLEKAEIDIHVNYITEKQIAEVSK